MIWLVLPLMLPGIYMAWTLIGCAAVTWVDDEDQRLWKWFACPDDAEVRFVIWLCWPAVIWKWLQGK